MRYLLLFLTLLIFNCSGKGGTVSRKQDGKNQNKNRGKGTKTRKNEKEVKELKEELQKMKDQLHEEISKKNTSDHSPEQIDKLQNGIVDLENKIHRKSAGSGKDKSFLSNDEAEELLNDGSVDSDQNRKNKSSKRKRIEPDLLYYFRLIKAGKLNLLKQEIQKDPSLIKKIDGEWGYSLLHAAIHFEQTKIVTYLLVQGADPNISDKDGNSPLTKSCYNDNLDIVQALLKYKAKPNLPDESGEYPLHVACEMGIAAIALILLKNNANPDQLNRKGKAPLHVSIIEEHDDLFDLLLSYNAKIDIPDENGMTAWLLCARQGYDDLMNKLFGFGANVNQVNEKDGSSAAHYAAKYGHKNVIDLLIQAKVFSNQKVDFRLQDLQGDTALHKALTKRHRGNRDERKDIALMLLKRDPKLSMIANNDNFSPLHFAAAGGYRGIAKKIADIYVKRKITSFSSSWMNLQTKTGGNTAFHLAILNKRFLIARDFAERYNDPNSGGIDINLQNDDGQTVYHCAVIKDSALLIDAFQKLKRPWGTYRFKLGLVDNKGNTIWHSAVKTGNYENVKRVFKKAGLGGTKPDLKSENNAGKTVPDLAEERRKKGSEGKKIFKFIKRGKF